MRVLGLSFSGHGAAACLVEDGRIVRAVNLERLTRRKFSLLTLPALFPHVRWLMDAVDPGSDPPLFDFYEWFPELVAYVAGERDVRRAGIDLVVQGSGTIFRTEGLESEYERFLSCFGGVRLHTELEHHLCHAYQAYLPSPFADTAILTIDGAGEPLARKGGASICTTLAHGSGERVEVLHEVSSPFSIGGLYESVTRHLGFRHEQEGNTMALASFGTDRIYERVKHTVRKEPGGAYVLDYDAAAQTSLLEIALREHCPARKPGEPFSEAHEDTAWACQAITEDVLLHLCRGLHERTGARRLAMAGGVALNCVANARVLRDTPFEELYVMPNAGDRGLAAGAALYGYHVVLEGKERHAPVSDGLGRPLERTAVLSDLRAAAGVEYRESADIATDVAELVAAGKVVGWMQGGSEFGPRALGHRSLIADPRSLRSKERLDAEIKRREWFRPYCPSVLLERADEFFEMRGPSPYMLQAVRVRPESRARIAGVVHVDGTARVQTVSKDAEPLYHRLISLCEERLGVPMVLNTSLNGYGEPMVETAADGVRALLSMQFDALAVGDFLVTRRARDSGP